jgi:hypothetical protein
MDMLRVLQESLRGLDLRGERGAIGWLTLGIIIGVILVIAGIIKFLIPGE